jgi:glutamyl-Q tRNA(Asp) synthetase
MPVTRFAPSPTGFLHLGHAYSASVAWEAAAGGAFLLRMEDTETERVRPEYVAAIFEDLAWLGLRWPEAVRFQSAEMPRYRAALERLVETGSVYPCFCSRKQIQAEIAAAGGAPHEPVGSYPGTCRNLPVSDRRDRIESGMAYAWRLDVREALRRTGPLFWVERDRGPQAVPEIPDPVVARKDAPTSYHLSVTVDDADQGIELVTRGRDIFPSTHVHRMLQALLDLPTPLYAHHPLVLDDRGERLAKRQGSLALRALREAGWRPEQVLAEAKRRLESPE